MSLRVKQEDLKLVGIDSGGSEILHYKGKPFTGIKLIYEDAGWLSGEIEFKNGYREGWEREYYENGQLESEVKMHNNIAVPGTWKYYPKK
ncbi:hypothetical protein [Flavobacterium sp.]|uniref:hypothetical protein n=1 Tax=Flavobacterium sp. TaxID=239 RepID=UPI002FDE5284